MLESGRPSIDQVDGKGSSHAPLFAKMRCKDSIIFPTCRRNAVVLTRVGPGQVPHLTPPLSLPACHFVARIPVYWWMMGELSILESHESDSAFCCLSRPNHINRNTSQVIFVQCACYFTTTSNVICLTSFSHRFRCQQFEAGNLCQNNCLCRSLVCCGFCRDIHAENGSALSTTPPPGGASTFARGRSQATPALSRLSHLPSGVSARQHSFRSPDHVLLNP